MPRDPKELGNKFGTYADAITAFAFVQSVAFSFTLGSNDTFLQHAVRVWWLIPLFLIVGNGIYIYLVIQCHRGEVALLEPLAPDAKAWDEKLGRGRLLVIGIALVLSLVAYTLSWLGCELTPLC